MTSQHPEAIPPNLDKIRHRYVLSTEVSEEAAKACEEKLTEYRERIQKICDDWGVLVVHGQPIDFISKILMYSHDKQELKSLAKGLDRVADLIAAHDKLEARSNLIKLAKDDPNFMIWAFGSFEDEIDRELAQLTVDEI